MPIGTPFHPELMQHCESLSIKDWAGYYCFKTYHTSHEAEYFAIRHAAGLIDVSPLFKYEVKGKDAGRFLDRIMVKPVSNLKPGRVTYLCWCDDQGKMLDDGTVTRMADDHFRVTAAEPSLYWFSKFTRGLDVTLADVTDDLGALAVQGPVSRDLLNDVTGGAVTDLKFFGMTETHIGSHGVWITRTGYTGDLGYEVWVDRPNAVDVYREIHRAGQKFGAMPCGLDAMDVARVEAGFIMNGVDYFSAHHCFVESRKSTPYELGLGWTVKLDREPFVGQRALMKEKKEGSDYALIGLELDYSETEALFAKEGLPPEICSAAWRDGKPVYDQIGEFIGKATSGAWSPTLKKNLALATVLEPFSKPGTTLKSEITVEYQRHMVTAKVVPMPFFNPPRKRS